MSKKIMAMLDQAIDGDFLDVTKMNILKDIRKMLQEEQYLKDLAGKTTEKTRYQVIKKLFQKNSKENQQWRKNCWTVKEALQTYQVMTDSHILFVLKKIGRISNLPELPESEWRPDVKKLLAQSWVGETATLSTEDIRKIIALSKQKHILPKSTLLSGGRELIPGKNIFTFGGIAFDFQYVGKALQVLGAKEVTLRIKESNLLCFENDYGYVMLAPFNVQTEDEKAAIAACPNCKVE